MWGIWNGMSARDCEAVRRVGAIQRFLAPFFTSPDWEPHVVLNLPLSIVSPCHHGGGVPWRETQASTRRAHAWAFPTAGTERVCVTLANQRWGVSRASTAGESVAAKP